MPRSRLHSLGAALVALALGLGARALLTGAPAKLLGVALYATFVYALVLLAAPRVRIGVALAVALAFCFAVELAQLTPWPAYLSSRHVLLRLALGAHFSAWDLVTYVPGALLGALVDALARRALERERSQPS